MDTAPVEVTLPVGTTLSLGQDQLQVGAQVHLNGPHGPILGVVVSVRRDSNNMMDVEIMHVAQLPRPAWFRVNAHFRVRADNTYWVVRSIEGASFRASPPVDNWPFRDFTFAELGADAFEHFDTTPPAWLKVGAHLQCNNRIAVVMGVLGWRIVCRGVQGDSRRTTSTNFFGEHCELILPEVLALWRPVGTTSKAPPAVPAGPLTRFDRDDVL